MSTQILPDFIQARIRSEWTPVGKMHENQAALIADLFRLRFPAVAMKCNGRIERAIVICSKVGACRRTDIPTQFIVSSESNSKGSYLVDISDQTCTCPDSGKGNLCKHRLAIGFHLYGIDWMTEARDEMICGKDTPAANLFAADLEKKRAKEAEAAKAANREQEIHAARMAELVAWRAVVEITDRYEYNANTQNNHGQRPSFEEIENLRAQMIQAVELANTASDAYINLIKTH